METAQLLQTYIFLFDKLLKCYSFFKPITYGDDDNEN